MNKPINDIQRMLKQYEENMKLVMILCKLIDEKPEHFNLINNALTRTGKQN